MSRSSTVLDLCQQLRLTGMADAYQSQINAASSLERPFDERLVELLKAQLCSQQSKRQQTLARQAKLRYPNAFLDQIDHKLYSNLKVATLKQLARCDWVRQRQHVLLIGPTGTGKTTLACALANEAIKQQLPVQFFRMANLMLELVAALKEHALPKLTKKLTRVPLLILDDWGNTLMSSEERHLLFELIEARDRQGSLIITSQYPVTTWHESFQDATIADSVLDRIVHCSHQITLSGESIRKQLGLNTESPHGE